MSGVHGHIAFVFNGSNLTAGTVSLGRRATMSIICDVHFIDCCSGVSMTHGVQKSSITSR